MTRARTASFENYVSDLIAITAQTNQLSGEFFGKLSDPGDLCRSSSRPRSRPTAAPPRTSRAGLHVLDTPGDLGDAQNELDLAYELRARH